MLCSLQKELKFDLVSPVDELAKQIRMEFDFKHEAVVMNEVGKSLRVRMPPALMTHGEGRQFCIVCMPECPLH